MVDLVELLQQAGRDIKLENQMGFYSIALRSPFRYELELSKSYKKKLKLGKNFIPKANQIVTFQISDFYELRSDEFKQEFPEFENIIEAAVIEQVSKVKLARAPRDVEIYIDRYLINRI